MLSTAALVALFNATGGPNWLNKSGWLRSPVCDPPWHGVRCVGGQPASLNLTEYNRLSGTLPSEIGLSGVDTSLFLSKSPFRYFSRDFVNNISMQDGSMVLQGSFSGTIPSQLGLTNLSQNLAMSETAISGTIPNELGTELLQLRGMLVLRVSSLSGTLPQSIGDDRRLTTYVDMYWNRISGTVPPKLSHLHALSRLALSNNTISGTIPTQLGRLTSLQSFLDLFGNRISGTVPTQIGKIPAKESLFLSNNRLSGNVYPTPSSYPLLCLLPSP